MANETKPANRPASEQQGGLHSEASKAKRAASRAKTASLGDADKFAVSVLARASRACKLLQDRIKAGNRPTGEALKAASLLAGAASDELFDN